MITYQLEIIIRENNGTLFCALEQTGCSAAW